MILSIIKTKSRMAHDTEWYIIQRYCTGVPASRARVTPHPIFAVRRSCMARSLLGNSFLYGAKRNNARREHSGHAQKPDNLMTKGK